MPTMTDERYTPNTVTWRKGDIVIHHADAKQPHMLMRVIGYARDGLCKTQYVDKSHKRTIWRNDIKNLLDPAKFGLDLSTVPLEGRQPIVRLGDVEIFKIR